MFVDVTATNSLGVSLPVSTPRVHSIDRRSSRPPVPFGILVKSLISQPFIWASVENSCPLMLPILAFL